MPLKTSLIATLATATLASAAAPGAYAASSTSRTTRATRTSPSVSAADLEAIRAEFGALRERLERLEAQNARLAEENAQLRAAPPVDEENAAVIDYLRSQVKEQREDTAKLQADADKVRGSDWASKMKWRVDMRYRHEEIRSDGVSDRLRDRIRLRAGLEARATDDIVVVAQIASGGTDPRSTNQTLSGEFDREPVGLDLAYAEWTLGTGLRVTAGKMRNPLTRPATMTYDNDLNPEGLAFNFDRGTFFGSAYYWTLAERATRADSVAVGGQFGVKYPVGNGSLLTAALTYQDLGATQGRCDLFGNSANGNSTTIVTVFPGTPCSAGNNVRLTYDFKVAGAFAQFDTTVGMLPLTLFGEYSKNSGADNGLDTSFAVGFTLGRAGNPHTWEVGYLYQEIEKDALFGMFVDSDFNAGNTDGKGSVLRLGYAPLRNWTLNATYFMNDRNISAPTQLDYKRLMLDFNVRY